MLWIAARPRPSRPPILTLENSPFGSSGARIGLPKTNPAQEGVSIMTEFGAVREIAQLLRFAATEHDVISDHRFFQLTDREHYFALPFLAAEFVDSGFPEKIFDDPMIAIGQVAQFKRKKHVRKEQG